MTTKIMTDLFINIKSFLVGLFWGITKGIKAFYLNILSSIKDFKQLPHKLHNLTDTNLDLAHFHLRNGNVSDAIMRLKIVKNFISPNNKQAEYELAWCYFIKGDIDKALSCIDNCLDVAGAAELKNLLTNQNIEQIPDEILQKYKNFTAINWENRFDNSLDLHQKLVKNLAVQMKVINPGCQILDLGAQIGASAAALAKQLPNKYFIDAVEQSQEMLQELRQTGFYRNVYDEQLLSFLNNTKVQYDVVISALSFGFAKNLSPYFAALKVCLKQDGYFALALPIDIETKIASNKIEFLYNEVEVVSALKQAGFELMSCETLKAYNVWTLRLV